MDSLSLEHVKKCLFTMTAAGSALPEAASQPGFLMGYHCVCNELVNTCVSLAYIQNVNKFSKTDFASLRLFINVSYLV